MATSIQSLVTAHHSANQCAVDWVNENVFTHGGGYVASIGLVSGSEQAYAPDSGFTVPTFGTVWGTNPIEVDLENKVYITWLGGNGGGLIKLDGDTLAQEDLGGSVGSPPSGFLISGGGLVNIPVGDGGFVQYFLGTGNTAYRQYVVWGGVLYQGPHGTYGSTGAEAIACQGQIETGDSYMVVSESDTVCRVDLVEPGDLYQDTRATFSPTDIDGSWTAIRPVGCVCDQSDRHLLLWLCNGETKSDHRLIKMNGSTGAIIWNRDLPGSAYAYLSHQWAQGFIEEEKIAIFSITPNTVTIIDTTDGSVYGTITDGLAGITLQGGQCYSDALRGLVINASFVETTGSPTRLNSTPSSFSGWSVLYPGDVTPPLPGGLGTNGEWFHVSRVVRRR